jgi:hypothetical protein
MLPITVAETATEQKWTLVGRLVVPWVAELRTSWKNRQRSQNGRTCACIDKRGQRLLRAMSKEGPQFVPTVSYVKHALDELKPGDKGELRKLISYLFVEAHVRVR